MMDPLLLMYVSVSRKDRHIHRDVHDSFNDGKDSEGVGEGQNSIVQEPDR